MYYIKVNFICVSIHYFLFSYHLFISLYLFTNLFKHLRIYLLISSFIYLFIYYTFIDQFIYVLSCLFIYFIICYLCLLIYFLCQRLRLQEGKMREAGKESMLGNKRWSDIVSKSREYGARELGQSLIERTQMRLISASVFTHYPHPRDKLHTTKLLP